MAAIAATLGLLCLGLSFSAPTTGGYLVVAGWVALGVAVVLRIRESARGR